MIFIKYGMAGYIANTGPGPKSVAQARMDICVKCPFFKKTTKQCQKCGCFMPVKVRLGGMKCPAGKW